MPTTGQLVAGYFTNVRDGSGADVFHSQNKSRRSLVVQNVTLRRNKGQANEEIVPDSEEERERSRRAELPEEEIVISSESEEEEDEIKALLVVDSQGKKPSPPDRWASDSEDEEDLETTPTPQNGRRSAPSRGIIESSESESEDNELDSPLKASQKSFTRKPLDEDVIELTSSSEDEAKAPRRQHPAQTSHERALQEKLPPYLTQEDDGAILIFDEPKSARRPVKIVAPRDHSPAKQPQNVAASVQTDIPTPSTTSVSAVTFTDPPSATSAVNMPVSRKTIRTKSAKLTTRVSKKAIAEAEQTSRERYAQDLFDELNKSVFKNGLPEKTELRWNKRLLTTAGKAKYRRSRDGVETSEIELATKVLDCEERIRNTLSHEMCHLATWVIDKNLDENHGKLFKYWASRVTRKRPDISITTKHNYEISYPYKWECEKCQKIYGRYSNSIRPDECVCGACREGRLAPLFTVRRKAQTPKVGRLAAGKPQGKSKFPFPDSYIDGFIGFPCSLPLPVKQSTISSEAENHTGKNDADIKSLTVTMADVHIF
ncbi:HMG box-containing protein C19G7.04 [Leucoagaricus sp. SymC.cos]|nr:HMG box-containing protein C19G7.04 [Leucoagaricus sp. SymC.cos]